MGVVVPRAGLELAGWRVKECRKEKESEMALLVLVVVGGVVSAQWPAGGHLLLEPAACRNDNRSECLLRGVAI